MIVKSWFDEERITLFALQCTLQVRIHGIDSEAYEPYNSKF